MWWHIQTISANVKVHKQKPNALYLLWMMVFIHTLSGNSQCISIVMMLINVGQSEFVMFHSCAKFFTPQCYWQVATQSHSPLRSFLLRYIILYGGQALPQVFLVDVSHQASCRQQRSRNAVSLTLAAVHSFFDTSQLTEISKYTESFYRRNFDGLNDEPTDENRQ